MLLDCCIGAQSVSERCVSNDVYSFSRGVYKGLLSDSAPLIMGHCSRFDSVKMNRALNVLVNGGKRVMILFDALALFMSLGLIIDG